MQESFRNFIASIGATSAAILLRGPSAQFLELHQGINLPEGWTNRKFKIDSMTDYGRAYQTNRTVISEPSLPRINEGPGRRAYSSMAIPLTERSRLLGVLLVLHNRNDHTFNSIDQAKAEAFAAKIVAIRPRK